MTYIQLNYHKNCGLILLHPVFMKQHLRFFFILLLATCWSCNNRDFPEVQNISAYKSTTFLPTLEQTISNDTNAVYCVTLLYAWDEVRKLINQPLIINKDLVDLTTLNTSKSFIQVLKSDEYEASGEVNGQTIETYAEFKKSLPFENKLQSFTDRLIFDKQKVASFGMIGYDNDIANIITIVYYKNDDNFIIKLQPKNKEHEIILFQSSKTFHSMSAMYTEIERLTRIGNKERENTKQNWKYIFSDEDQLVIPKFKFNIETNFATLEGKQFKTSKQEYTIDKAWQRTAFILDEAEAEVESEAVFEVTTEAPDEEYEKPKPKKMIFNKPFLTLLKRTDAPNPYFGLWTTNTELMIKK